MFRMTTRAAMLAVAASQLLAGCGAVYFSSRRGQGRRLENVSPLETVAPVSLIECLLNCSLLSDCQSFNYGAADATCEKFNSSACNAAGGGVEAVVGWQWFDLSPDPAQESSNQLWSDTLCTDKAVCRDDVCKKRLEESCFGDVQCQDLVDGPVLCDQTCECGAGSWQFNTTHCLPDTLEVLTDGMDWLWKKIHGDICRLQFNVMATDNIQVALSETIDEPMNQYIFRIGKDGNTAITLERDPADGDASTVASYAGSTLSSTRFMSFSLDWCQGFLRIFRDGIMMYISYNDPQPFLPAYARFWSGERAGKWQLKANLVDLWMDDWSSERIYAVPKAAALTKRVTVPADQPMTTEFEFRGPQDCWWVATAGLPREWYSADTQLYRVTIGAWSNSISTIERFKGSHVYLNYTYIPNVVAAGEFRKFKIQLKRVGAGMQIQAWKGDDAQPFLDATDSQGIDVRYEAFLNVNSPMAHELKLVKYNSDWSYEGGYRAGANLA